MTTFYNVTILMPDGKQVGLGLLKYPTIDDMQQWVGGGLIERVVLPYDDNNRRRDMLVNEDGYTKGMEVNHRATETLGTGRVVVGPAAILENFDLR
jgi:hypothetical protein